ncbi:hypothetical protein [Streptomyces sp. NPDC018833]|uniref:hypothetical protein n=1 Tax=Streptomyces sp. NPDC018833 TaxID=3365053 RepID=UPI0037B4203C
MALTPADWGPDFGQGDPYEAASDELTVNKNCEAISRPPRGGTLASLIRWSVQYEPSFFAGSEVRVFADAATAQKYIADAKKTTHTCATQTQGKTRWEDVREAAPPQLNGFDELLAEESKLTSTNDGMKANDLWLALAGRVDATVLTTVVRGATKDDAQVRKHAREGLQLMQKRLAGASPNAARQ